MGRASVRTLRRSETISLDGRSLRSSPLHSVGQAANDTKINYDTYPSREGAAQAKEIFIFNQIAIFIPIASKHHEPENNSILISIANPIF
jgi:hypothetical protein